ncbi:uncharacterized [Tachysurus ichikawai]
MLLQGTVSQGAHGIHPAEIRQPFPKQTDVVEDFAFLLEMGQSSGPEITARRKACWERAHQFYFNRKRRRQRTQRKLQHIGDGC